MGGWRHFEAYQFNLSRLVEKLSIDDAVEWCGWVAYDEGFAAYYEAASVLISMSEHEGFCLPLIEAMVFDLPVVAYAGAAIPDTLGDAGVLVHQKHYESIAWFVRALDTDPTYNTATVGIDVWVPTALALSKRVTPTSVFPNTGARAFSGPTRWSTQGVTAPSWKGTFRPPSFMTRS